MPERFVVTDAAVKAVSCKLFDDAGLDPSKELSDGCEDWETEAAGVREELEALAFKLNQIDTGTK